MRKMLLAAAGGATLLSVAMLTPASAFPGAPGATQPAADSIDPVEKACWRDGWHGWGWYPCGGYYYRYGWGPRWRHW